LTSALTAAPTAPGQAETERLETVLARAGACVLTFVHDLAGIVAGEHYREIVHSPIRFSSTMKSNRNYPPDTRKAGFADARSLLDGALDGAGAYDGADSRGRGRGPDAPTDQARSGTLTTGDPFMAARPTWKGYLKISLVNIPIKVFPATDAGATLSFNQLHAECQTRIQQKRWCPKCEREVPNTDLVKGYEFEKGRYVVVGEQDIEKVRVESTRVISLEKFVDDAAIDPIYLERPYYLAPDGDVAKEAFAVMREGMKGKAGIGKVALYGREYFVKVQPRERGLVMYTLRHATEIRSMDAIDELADMPERNKPGEVKLAQQVIGTFEGDLDFASYRDEYQEGLREIIQAKVDGREIVTPEIEAPPKVVNLMEALRKSLDTISGSKKKPAAVGERIAREDSVSRMAPRKRARA
jgi:DNA end-binding protein Ku